MYAIIETGGKQTRVQEGKKLLVDRMGAEIGTEITLDKVLLLGGDSPKIGTPFVEGAKVTATVTAHSRGEKVLVFKKRRRKGSRNLKGYRHDYTELAIKSIVA